MADEKKTWRSVFGAIQFPPKDGEANGKNVRNIVIQQNGFGPTAVRVYATVWPGHDHVKLEQGDIVFIEGPYTKRTSTNDETGEDRTFHNISVARIKNLGALDSGKRTETTSDDDEPVDDDDIPF